MAKKTIETDLIGDRVRVKAGHGIHADKEGIIRGVYVSSEPSVFGNVMFLIADDKGELFDTFASIVTLICPECHEALGVNHAERGGQCPRSAEDPDISF